MPQSTDLCLLSDVRDWLNLSSQAMAPQQIVMVQGGTGYTVASAAVVAGTGVGSGLTLGSPTLSGGSVVAVPIVTAGLYSVAPTVAITGNGTGAQATVYFAADVALARLITSCSKLMLRLMNRDTTALTTVAERRNGSGTDRMALRNWPVSAVNSLVVNGLSIPASPDGMQAGYVTDGYSVMLVGNGAIVHYQIVGGSVFFKGYGNVTINYTYGWTATPEDIAQACIELVSQRWARKGHIDQDSVSMGGPVAQTTSYQKLAVPREVQQVCDRYRLIPIPEI